MVIDVDYMNDGGGSSSEEENDFEYKYILHLHIKDALIDKQSFNRTTMSHRNYHWVIVSDKYGREHRTRRATGRPKLPAGDYLFVWNEEVDVGFDEMPRKEWLNFELIREGFPGDPGTSSGYYLVGKAQICLPERLSNQKQMQCKEGVLVKSEELSVKVQGTIDVGMNLAMNMNHGKKYVRFF